MEVPSLFFTCVEGSAASVLRVGAESYMGLLEAVADLGSMIFPSVAFREYEYGETGEYPPPPVSLSFVSHPSFLMATLEGYRGEGLFKNFGFLLVEGGAKEDLGLLFVSGLDALTLRLRGSANPDEDLYCSARYRRCSSGCFILSVDLRGDGW